MAQPPSPSAPRPAACPPSSVSHLMMTQALVFRCWHRLCLESLPPGPHSSRNQGKIIFALSILKASGLRGHRRYWDWPRTPSVRVRLTWSCPGAPAPRAPRSNDGPTWGTPGRPSLKSHSPLRIFFPNPSPRRASPASAWQSGGGLAISFPMSCIPAHPSAPIPPGPPPPALTRLATAPSGSLPWPPPCPHLAL